MRRSLDRFDIALLNLMQSNNQATAETLARSVPLSPSAITRRLRRLRDEGHIAADISILSTSLVRSRLRAIVQIQLQEHAQEKGLSNLRKRLADAANVQICYEVTGSFDLIVVVVCHNLEDFNEFADEVFAGAPCVRRYETSFVKKEIKNSPAIWLDESSVGSSAEYQ